MSNVIAGVVRGQIPYLEEHIAEKKAIYERYKAAFQDLPIEMNPYDEVESKPNFWLSCMLIKPEAMCKQVRGNKRLVYQRSWKNMSDRNSEVLETYNAEGRPL